ncbi:unnamed protein product [Musa acuminata subsp. burmannicoides]
MSSSRSRRVEYDRFIPFRSAMDMDYARFALTRPSKPQRDGSRESPSSVAYQKLLDECILKNRSRIFAFKTAPEAPASKLPQFDEPIRPQKKQQRRILKNQRGLVIHGLLDDNDLNLLDWEAIMCWRLALRTQCISGTLQTSRLSFFYNRRRQRTYHLHPLVARLCSSCCRIWQFRFNPD